MTDSKSINLATVFEHLRTEPFLIIDPSGNHGDQLIFHGGRKLAALAGLNYVSARHDQNWHDLLSGVTCVYIQGGGGFVPFWSGTPVQILKELRDLFRGTVIVGPSTFWPDKFYLEQNVACNLAAAGFKNVHIFCREKKSFAAVKEACQDVADVHIDHDTALALTRDDLLKLGEVDPETARKNRAYTLYALRTDKEALAIGRCGIAKMPVDPIDYCYNLSRWIKLHASAKRIVTNRLHSAIAGTILGVSTILLPNSYHKSESVWEYSLKERGTNWANHLDESLADRLSGLLGLSRYWRETPLLQRALGRARFGSGV